MGPEIKQEEQLSVPLVFLSEFGSVQISLEFFLNAGIPEPAKSLGFDLADSLSSDPHLFPNLIKSQGSAIYQTVAHLENLGFPWRKLGQCFLKMFSK